MVKQRKDISTSDIDFDTLADELSAKGIDSLNMNKVKRDSLQKQRALEARRLSELETSQKAPHPRWQRTC